MANNTNRRRRSIRYEAARIMADEGVRDFRKAKEKACLRLGVSTNHSIPSNLEIEDALEEQLTIFENGQKESLQQKYLEVALIMMDFFADYTPKLTGAALTGVITSSRPVEVHIFSDTVEEVCARLDETGLQYDQMEKRKRFAGNRFENIPGLDIGALEVDVELFCFLPSIPYPPLSPTTSKPIKVISRKKVRRLLS